MQAALVGIAAWTLLFAVVPLYKIGSLEETIDKREKQIADMDKQVKDARWAVYAAKRERVLLGLAKTLMTCATPQYDGKEMSWKHLMEGTFEQCFTIRLNAHLATFESTGPQLSIVLTDPDKACLAAKLAAMAKSMDNELPSVRERFRGAQLDEVLRSFERGLGRQVHTVSFYVTTPEKGCPSPT